MDDKSQTPNPTPMGDQSVNPSPATPAVPPSDPAAAPAAPNQNNDLQSLSQDLEKLAKEAAAQTPTAQVGPAPVAPVPVAPTEAVPPAPSVPAPEPAVPAEVAQEPAPQAEKAETADAKVTVYTTTSCPFCKAEKEYLTGTGLTFVEKNVEEDTEALKEMLSIGDNFAGVPVTVLSGPKGKKVVKGFTKDEFEQELVNVGLKDAPVAAAKEPEIVVPPAEVPPAQPAPEAPTAPAAPAAPAAEPQVPDLN